VERWCRFGDLGAYRLIPLLAAADGDMISQVICVLQALTQSMLRHQRRLRFLNTSRSKQGVFHFSLIFHTVNFSPELYTKSIIQTSCIHSVCHSDDVGLRLQSFCYIPLILFFSSIL
jgi:hypothetical protein